MKYATKDEKRMILEENERLFQKQVQFEKENPSAIFSIKGFVDTIG